MTDELEPVQNRAVQKAADFRTTQLENMRDKLSKFLPRALDIVTELAETAENERVRLAAAESILDRAGLGKSSTTQVTVSQAEHDIATNEANELVAKLSRQKAIEAGKDVPEIRDPEVLFVHEGDDDTLPTAAHVEGVVEATSTEA